MQPEGGGCRWWCGGLQGGKPCLLSDCQLMKIYQWCVDLHNHSIACTLLIVMLILSCAEPSFISLYYFVPHPYPSIILWYFMYHYFVSVCSACCIYIYVSEWLATCSYCHYHWPCIACLFPLQTPSDNLIDIDLETERNNAVVSTIHFHLHPRLLV